MIDPLVALASDARFALRGLRRTPAFTLTATLTLALAIGAAVSILSAAYAVLFRPLPFPGQSRLVSVHGYYPAGWVRALAARTHSFTAIAAEGDSRELNVSLAQAGGTVERAFTQAVSANAFSVYDLHPAIGRFFTTEEEVAGADHVVLLSHAFWQQHFASSPGVLGRTLSVDGVDRQVVGVLPVSAAAISDATALWIPVSVKAGDPIDPWAMFNLHIIGRLRPGVTTAGATAELRALQPQLLKLFPWTMPLAWNADVTATPLLDLYIGDSRPKLLLLLAAVLLLLLIACANVTNLLLARATAREAELATRAALGASPFRLARQSLTESLVLALLSGLLSLAVTAAGLPLLRSILPADPVRLSTLSLDVQTALFVAIITGAAALLFGTLPALRALRMSPAPYAEASRALASGTRRRFRASSMLVVFQIALTVVVLNSAGLMLHSLWHLLHADLGFRTQNTIAARVALDATACRQPGHCAAYLESLLGRLQHLPGITRAATVDDLPLSGWDYGQAFDAQDHPRAGNAPPEQTSFRTVSPGYFALMGITLLQGETFTSADAAPAAHSVIINRALAEHLWPHGDALGKQIEWVGMEKQQGVIDPGKALVVTGVVSGTRHSSLDDPQGAGNYEMYSAVRSGWESPTNWVLLRSSLPAAGAAAILRDVVAGMRPQASVSHITTLDQVVSHSASSSQSLALLLLAIGALAAIVGALGIYGLMAYIVSWRLREFGLRLALGAARADILWLVLRNSFVLLALGAVLGAAAAIPVGHSIGSLLYGVTALDLPAYSLVLCFMLLLGVAGALPSALRAASAEPGEMLRAE